MASVIGALALGGREPASTGGFAFALGNGLIRRIEPSANNGSRAREPVARVVRSRWVCLMMRVPRPGGRDLQHGCGRFERMSRACFAAPRRIRLAFESDDD